MDTKLLFDITPFDWPSIFTALLCGTIIGLERQVRGKPAGIRTSSLIILGTYVFIACSMYVSKNANMTDPSRIIGQVITGIGFLGAGVMLSKGRSVYGVTSAATIWALAAVGVCIGIGQLASAFKLSVVVVVILFGVDYFEEYSQNLGKNMHSRFHRWRNRDDE
ncbi:MgtC/SapB family protein [Bermanella sp. WJH001]|uniref:MgtC/SapB family protein n=1 Tax=Bermanella sp. WJH001 TaxID=3048005 RepID=UPI0024BDBE63|nr:MgtC/SapB family protein [Bermanella sp. WJH001]MDJ1539885.1 MgtC/SapB family protein [Bermanella sp. WJH001]